MGQAVRLFMAEICQSLGGCRGPCRALAPSPIRKLAQDIAQVMPVCL